MGPRFWSQLEQRDTPWIWLPKRPISSVLWNVLRWQKFPDPATNSMWLLSIAELAHATAEHMYCTLFIFNVFNLFKFQWPYVATSRMDPHIHQPFMWESASGVQRPSCIPCMSQKAPTHTTAPFQANALRLHSTGPRNVCWSSRSSDGVSDPRGSFTWWPHSTQRAIHWVLGPGNSCKCSKERGPRERHPVGMFIKSCIIQFNLARPRFTVMELDSIWGVHRSPGHSKSRQYTRQLRKPLHHSLFHFRFQEWCKNSRFAFPSTQNMYSSPQRGPIREPASGHIRERPPHMCPSDPTLCTLWCSGVCEELWGLQQGARNKALLTK